MEERGQWVNSDHSPRGTLGVIWGTWKLRTEDSKWFSPSRVYGIKRLRVVDASIMPQVTTGNTAAPCMMIAERAADFIRNYWRSDQAGFWPEKQITQRNQVEKKVSGSDHEERLRPNGGESPVAGPRYSSSSY